MEHKFQWQKEGFNYEPYKEIPASGLGNLWPSRLFKPSVGHWNSWSMINLEHNTIEVAKTFCHNVYTEIVYPTFDMFNNNFIQFIILVDFSERTTINCISGLSLPRLVMVTLVIPSVLQV